MRKIIPWISGLSILACATVLIGAWQLRARDAMHKWDPATARKKDIPMPVRTVKVVREDVSETVGGTAMTMPAQSAVLQLPLSSSNLVERVVSTVNVQAGDFVKKGDVLLTFEPDLFAQTVKQRQALVSKCEAELTGLQKLLKSEAASEMQVRTAEVELETARLELKLAQRDLDLCSVVTPIDGIVDELTVAPGMRIPGGSRLAVVHQLGPILVQMDFPMERIDALQKGQEGELVLDAFSQEKFSGKVSRIPPIVAAKTRVLPIMLEVDNPDNRIKAGISGFVRLKTVQAEVVTVPSVAVIEKQQKAMVVCVEDGKAQIREVHTGRLTDDGDIEIVAGLEVGEVVVVHGQDSLEEGDVVNVDWEQWTHRRVAQR